MLQVTTSNRILIDYENIGLSVVQRKNGTVVYTPESKNSGQKYEEHKMPHKRYSLTHLHPISGAPGIEQFETDIKNLLKRLYHDKKA